MSRLADDTHLRRGWALLLAVVLSAVVAICVVALWKTAARSRRVDLLERAGVAARSLADSVAVRTVQMVDSGVWRSLTEPGRFATVQTGTSAGRSWRTQIGRSGWLTVVVRSDAAVRTGVPRVTARADQRTLIPLMPPLAVPTAALTGVEAWTVDGAALVDVPVGGADRVCRPATGVAPARIQAFPASLDLSRWVALDPDTAPDSLAGAFRLTHGALTRPLFVEGMVALDTDLVLGADLRLTGVLISRGSVRPAGGRLDVTGAVVSGDAGGGHSGLGPGDQVRYDACAIRRAVERVTRPGPAATWKQLSLF